jgi:hypothetical protein
MRRILLILLLLSSAGAGIYWYFHSKAPAPEDSLRLQAVREGARALRQGETAPAAQSPAQPDNTPVDDATRASLARMFEAQRKEREAHQKGRPAQKNPRNP